MGRREDIAPRRRSLLSKVASNTLRQPPDGISFSIT